jgi:uncharacterized protein
MKKIIPIIKVVGSFCNLRCSYCFASSKSRATPKLINKELLEKFLSQYMEIFSGHLTFIWHGGEPLLAGIPFFQTVVNFQNKYLKSNQIIQNTVQTNATLIDKKWASFFKEHNFGIGVSLDGNASSHNRFRKDINKKGSFKKVIRGIKILRKYNLEPGIIQTLTKSNATPDCIKKNFHFLVNILGIKSFGINHFFDINKINKAMADQKLDNKIFTESLKNYITLWIAQEDATLRIREIDNFLAGIFGKQALDCSFNGSCGQFLCLEYDGRVYPCDRFCGEKQFLLGNLSKESLSKILKRLSEYAQEVNSLPIDCLKCKWRFACHNGCTHHRIGGIKGKYYFCETRKNIFVYLKQMLT